MAAVQFADERALVVHQCPRAARRCGPFQEIRESDLDPGALRLESLLQFAAGSSGKRSHGHFAAVLVQHLDETTHVRALEVVRKIDRHRECRDGLLLLN